MFPRLVDYAASTDQSEVDEAVAPRNVPLVLESEKDIMEEIESLVCGLVTLVAIRMPSSDSARFASGNGSIREAQSTGCDDIMIIDRHGYRLPSSGSEADSDLSTNQDDTDIMEVGLEERDYLSLKRPDYVSASPDKSSFLGSAKRPIPVDLAPFATHRAIAGTSSGSSDSESSSTDSSESEDSDTVFNRILSVCQQKRRLAKQRLASGAENQRRPVGEKEFLDIQKLLPFEELKITAEDDVHLMTLGNVETIMDSLVIIQSGPVAPALDENTVLFTKGRKSLGKIFDVFGPVTSPMYLIRLGSADAVAAAEVAVGDAVYFAPDMKDWTVTVFLDALKQIKATDANWEEDGECLDEPPDFSDDDEERRYYAWRKAKTRPRDQDSSCNEDDPVIVADECANGHDGVLLTRRRCRGSSYRRRGRGHGRNRPDVIPSDSDITELQSVSQIQNVWPPSSRKDSRMAKGSGRIGRRSRKFRGSFQDSSGPIRNPLLPDDFDTVEVDGDKRYDWAAGEVSPRHMIQQQQQRTHPYSRPPPWSAAQIWNRPPVRTEATKSHSSEVWRSPFAGRQAGAALRTNARHRNPKACSEENREVSRPSFCSTSLFTHNAPIPQFPPSSGPYSFSIPPPVLPPPTTTKLPPPRSPLPPPGSPLPPPGSPLPPPGSPLPPPGSPVPLPCSTRPRPLSTPPPPYSRAQQQPAPGPSIGMRMYDSLRNTLPHFAFSSPPLFTPTPSGGARTSMSPNSGPMYPKPALRASAPPASPTTSVLIRPSFPLSGPLIPPQSLAQFASPPPSVFGAAIPPSQLSRPPVSVSVPVWNPGTRFASSMAVPETSQHDQGMHPSPSCHPSVGFRWF